MTKEEAAAALNGCEYGNEGNSELFAQMKAGGLVAVFGASDDLMEFRGAIHDEIGCYGGGTAPVTKLGRFAYECDCNCDAFVEKRDAAVNIDAIWDSEGYSWIYQTEIPHAQFDVTEDGETYCRGIVFALSDVPA